MQSNPGNSRPATLMGVLAAVLAAFTRWLISRLFRLFALRSRSVEGFAGAAAGRFNGRFETPREPLSTPAQLRSGYAGYAKAVTWSACAGPWARDVATGALVGGATVGSNTPVAAIVTNSPVKAGATGDPR